MRKHLLLSVLFLLLGFPVNANGEITELRYSTEIEQDDKFTWEVQVYTDDGNDVLQEENHFGKVLSGSTIEFTAIADPSRENLAEEEDTIVFDIFKIEIDGTQVTKISNLGIAQFLIMPTQIIFSDDESKNYVNYYFTSILNGSVSTDPDRDIFSITVENISYSFDSETILIDTWELSYGRKSGIVQEMGLIGETSQEQGGDNLELHIAFQRGFFARIPVPTYTLLLPLAILVLVKKKTN